jgi:hypothetical protein
MEARGDGYGLWPKYFLFFFERCIFSSFNGLDFL